MNGKRIAGFSALAIGAALTLTLVQTAAPQTFRLVAMRPSAMLKVGEKISCETIKLSRDIAEFRCSMDGAALLADTPTVSSPIRRAPKTPTATNTPNYSDKNSHARGNFSTKNPTRPPILRPTWAEYPAPETPQPYP